LSLARVLYFETDTAGRFEVPALERGQYIIGFAHPLVDSLGIELQDLLLTIAEPKRYEVTLAVPAPRTLVKSLCSADFAQERAGLFIGRVVRANGSAGAIASVHASWRELQFEGGSLGLVEVSREAQAEMGGWFAMCGLPHATQITVRGVVGTDSTGLLTLGVPEHGFLRRDLFVGDAVVASPATDTVAGRAAMPASIHSRAFGAIRGNIRNENGLPLRGVEVAIAGTAVPVLTSDSGEYSLNSIPPGTRSLVARRLGFHPHEAPVDIPAGAATQHDVVLRSVQNVLDTMRVTAAPTGRWANDFAARKVSTMGHFIEQAEIEQRNAMHVLDLLADVPGVDVVRSGLTKTIVMRSGTDVCFPTVYVDGVRQPTPVSARGVPEAPDLDWLSSSHVRGVEVYSRSGRVPVEFSDSRSRCGVLVIWTTTAQF
jgi:hypothetical protein